MPNSEVHSNITPNRDDMREHLEFLFGGYLGGHHLGMLEIAWRDATTGDLSHAKMFDTDMIDEAVEMAASISRVSDQNIYVGAALRKPGVDPDRRGTDEDFLALPAYYADLDDEEAVRGAKARYAHCRPNLVVVTGELPHPRAQLWWRQEVPDTDPQNCRRQNRAIATALAGDPTVINPSRVMRLAGSIAWPVKVDRKVELTKLILLEGAHPVHVEGQMAKAFPFDLVPVQPDATVLDIGGTEAADVSRLLTAIRTGDHWHNNMVRLTGHWLARGWSDDEMLAVADGLTLAGYTTDQTRRDVQAMVKSGRDKWNVPNPHHVVTEPDGLVDYAPKPGWNFDFNQIERRKWMLGNRLIRKFVTLTAAPGGLNKSIFTMEEGAGVVDDTFRRDLRRVSRRTEPVGP